MNNMNKIAKVTFCFWVMKICATTLGETAGDLLSMTWDVGYAKSSIILLSFFAISLFAQLKAPKFHPLLFWTVILTTSTAGTTMSDFMDRTLGFGYMKGSIILFVGLVLVLAIWRISEKLYLSTISRQRKPKFFIGRPSCFQTHWALRWEISWLTTLV